MRPSPLGVLLLLAFATCADRTIEPVGDGSNVDSSEEETVNQPEDEPETTTDDDSMTACDLDPDCTPGFTVCVWPGDDPEPKSCTEICDIYHRGKAVCVDRGCDGKTAVGWTYSETLASGACGEDWGTYHAILDVGCDTPIDFTQPNAGLVACCCWYTG
jgi:hypothetical protein